MKKANLRRVSPLRLAAEQGTSCNPGLTCSQVQHGDCGEKFLADPSLWWASRSDETSKRSSSHQDWPPRWLGLAQHAAVGLGDGQKSAAGPVEPSARQALWQNFLANPTFLWDTATLQTKVNYTDFSTTEDALCDSPHAWIKEKFRRGVNVHEVSQRSKGNLRLGIWKKECGERQLVPTVEALELLVQQRSIVPESIICSVLKHCIAQKDLSVGRRVHALTLKCGYETNTLLASHIIRMYTSHGRLQEATDVLSKLAMTNSCIWHSIILAHAQHGQPMQAIKLYQQMRHSSVDPNSHTYVAVLKACATVSDLPSGKQVHADILGSGLQPSVFVGSSLVNLYAKCGSMEDASRVFDKLPNKNVVTWNAMIAGYAQQGLGTQALTLFARMQQEGITASYATFLCMLKACASTGALDEGKEVHSMIEEQGLEDDLVLGNSLVDMYAKCGSLVDAQKVFDRLLTRDVVTWNALLTGYVQHGLGQEALMLYKSMKEDGMSLPNDITFVCVLKACASMQTLHDGKQLHLQIQERGLESNHIVGSSLVDMYSKCGSLKDARDVFDKLPIKDVVTWNSMLAGYAQHGLGQEVLDLYALMQEDSTTPADRVTFVCLLKACASERELLQGKQLHLQIEEQGLEAVLGNSLVDMYAKCGSLEDAQRVFDRLPTKDVVTWTAMVDGYSQQGLGQEALALYASMQQEGITSANNHTIVCLLKACASIGALQQGRELHYEVQKRGQDADVVVGSSLVDMYAKCGNLEDARKVFDKLPTKTVVTWNALLNGYCQHNDVQRALHCFQEMQEHGTKPDDGTFLSLLVACSHEGLVDEGKHYFRLMVDDHGISPTVYHYTCMVDLLGRSGQLDEAEHMLQTLPFKDAFAGWTSLLGACRSHGDVERGRRCFDHLIALEPQNAAPYALMQDIYTNAGVCKDVEFIESLRKSVGACKKPARAWIEVDNKVQTFTVGEERDDISSKLRSVNTLLDEERGQMPNVEQGQTKKEDALCGHAEKLALAYGLLNSPDGTTLVVTKNLRMCDDCHTGTKIMSRIERREIVVRDAHRVHHFVNGFCSCGDHH